MVVINSLVVCPPPCRWQTQRGVVVIPKSVTESRIRENIQVGFESFSLSLILILPSHVCCLSAFKVFDFTLQDEEMRSITALNRGWRYIVPMIEVSLKTRKNRF